MSETSGPDQPTKIAPKGEATVFDKEIGDDWGEAFEADEFMQAPDEGDGGEFFLDEDESASVVPEPDDADNVAAPEPSTPPPAFLANLLNSPFLRKYGDIFRTLPLLYRIALPSLLLMIFAAAWLFLADSPVTHPETKVVAPGQAASKQDIPEDLPVSVPELALNDEAISLDESGGAIVLEPSKVRKSWRLPPFLIPAKDDTKGDDVFFVEVDISLVFLLTEEEYLPTSHAVQVRDIIYQFFTNRPIYELRRYSLARGEMNRKLRAWIEKQWSEMPIATIVFNRYQVL